MRRERLYVRNWHNYSEPERDSLPRVSLVCTLIRNQVNRVLSTELLSRVLRDRSVNKIAVLMYHGVVRDNVFFNSWMMVRESEFARQMAYIKRHYHVLTISEILTNDGRISSFKDARPRAVITFDDGYRNNYTNAFPILRRLGLPAVIFLATDYLKSAKLFWFDRVIYSLQKSACQVLNISIGMYRMPSGPPEKRWNAINRILTDLKLEAHDKREKLTEEIEEVCGVKYEGQGELDIMNWKEVEEMSRSGLVEFGSHAHRHEILTQLTPDQVRQSVCVSVRIIKEHTGQDQVGFSFPNGNYNPSIIEVLKTCGIKYAVTTSNALWSNPCSPFEIPRIAVGGYDSHRAFVAHVVEPSSLLRQWVRTLIAGNHAKRGVGCRTR